MIVKQIDAKDTYSIRNQMLRPGLPESTCHFEGDHDELTLHLGAYIDNQLASVASFYLQCNSSFCQEYQMQLRGMATLPQYQAKGLSSALLRTAFPLIKKNHINVLWCNARSGAVGFYQKSDFEKIGSEFNINGVGPHFLMFKQI